jgi:uroporphyrinogen III methyltransferase / synthase
MAQSYGKVYLVGAGPGDPQLITVKGQECVKKADVIIYDYLANERLLDYRRPDSEIIYVGKQGDSHTLPQRDINALIIKKAKEGKTVARLKGGDPFIFGRGGEEAEELVNEGIAFEIIPGISSAIAVPTYAGIPLTHREHTSSVAFVTGHEDPGKAETKVHWDKIATGVGTIVFFMGMKNIANIVDNLVKNGRDPETPVAVIQWGTRTDQKVVTGTLTDIEGRVKKARLGPPAIIVVGEVVRLRDKLNWYESKPLFGRRILVTSSHGHADLLADKLIQLGATVVEFPMINVAPPQNPAELDAAIAGIGSYGWIIFRSMNAARFFIERLMETGRDVRALRDTKICAVGSRTAGYLGQHGIRPDLVPTEFSDEGLPVELAGTVFKGIKVLIPVPGGAKEILSDRLREKGADVTLVTAFEHAKPVADAARIRKLLEDKKIAAVTFTSMSAVGHFVRVLGRAELGALTAGVRIACIGPLTARTAEGYGMKADIMPEEYTITSLVDAMKLYFQEERKADLEQAGEIKGK